MKTLNPKIIKKISDKSGMALSSVGPAITRKKQSYPSLTPNAVAFLYAQSKGINILTLLDDEDKACLPAIEKRPTEKVIIKKSTPKKKQEVIINYTTTDVFIKGHIDEINRAYNASCYTSVVILARKIIENLIIDIFTKHYPPSIAANLDLYYDTPRSRHKDFSVILKNLYDKRMDFGTDKVIVEKLYSLTTKLKGDANDKAHSWFHLVERKKEVDDLEIQKIIELIKRLL